MNTATISVLCPGCKIGKRTLKFRAPSLFEPRVCVFKCKDCESDVVAKIRKLKKFEDMEDGRNCNVTLKIVRESDLLKALVAEEAQMRASEV